RVPRGRDRRAQEPADSRREQPRAQGCARRCAARLRRAPRAREEDPTGAGKRWICRPRASPMRLHAAAICLALLGCSKHEAKTYEVAIHGMAFVPAEL